jgi:hypothetical protein
MEMGGGDRIAWPRATKKNLTDSIKEIAKLVRDLDDENSAGLQCGKELLNSQLRLAKMLEHMTEMNAVVGALRKRNGLQTPDKHGDPKILLGKQGTFWARLQALNVPTSLLGFS